MGACIMAVYPTYSFLLPYTCLYPACTMTTHHGWSSWSMSIIQTYLGVLPFRAVSRRPSGCDLFILYLYLCQALIHWDSSRSFGIRLCCDRLLVLQRMRGVCVCVWSIYRNKCEDYWLLYREGSNVVTRLSFVETIISTYDTAVTPRSFSLRRILWMMDLYMRDFVSR